MTRLYEAAGDFRLGMVAVPLGNLSPGEHTIALEAWDTRNNWSSASVRAVVAPVDRLELSAVLFHPSPVREEGHFTNHLWSPAAAVEIAVYAVSGRRVARLEGEGRLGYNQVAWRPSGELAAGTYLYRVAVGGPGTSRAAATGALQLAP